MKKNDIIITIFGSTGDLCARKLLPAITKLYQNKNISSSIKVIALGRKEFDTNSYLAEMNKMAKNRLNLDLLKEIVYYFKIQITKQEGYHNLKEYIDSISSKDTKHIFYLAIGPDILASTAKQISDAGLIIKNNPKQVLVFEKPFGHDLKSAKEINQMLWQYADESQIFRIDHYLGKEMIQNMMTLRFANRIFDDIWDNKAIKSVRIMVFEDEGIHNRALYYDTSGALKDMVQSHLLQMVSLIAMDIPLSYSSTHIIDEKVKVLNSLTFDQDSLVFGQYEGYLNELHIPADSKTETFVYLKVFSNTKRFENVPFYIATGKKLDTKEQYIEIEFLPTKEQEKWKLPLTANKLRFNLYPTDCVELILNSKEVGLKENIVPIDLSFDMAQSVDGNIPEAYEKLILDIIMGSKTLFTRWDEIESSWQLIEKIQNVKKDLLIYSSSNDIKKYIFNKKKKTN